MYLLLVDNNGRKKMRVMSVSLFLPFIENSRMSSGFRIYCCRMNQEFSIPGRQVFKKFFCIKSCSRIDNPARVVMGHPTLAPVCPISSLCCRHERRRGSRCIEGGHSV